MFSLGATFLTLETSTYVCSWCPVAYELILWLRGLAACPHFAQAPSVWLLLGLSSLSTYALLISWVHMGIQSKTSSVSFCCL